MHYCPGRMAHSRSSSFTASGSVTGHSRNTSLTSLLTVRTSREETLDHDIYLLADQKGTFANLDKLSRLKNCIHYIYGANVIVKLLARPGQNKKYSNSSKTFKNADDTSSYSQPRRSTMVPATVDQIIAIEQQGMVPTSKLLYYA